MVNGRLVKKKWGEKMEKKKKKRIYFNSGKDFIKRIEIGKNNGRKKRKNMGRE